MKTEIIVREKSAALVVTAETQFEREMLKQVEMHEGHKLRISTTSEWGSVTNGNLVVTFETPEPARPVMP